MIFMIFFVYLIFFVISYFNIVVLYLNERDITIVIIYTQIADDRTKIKIKKDLFLVI